MKKVFTVVFCAAVLALSGCGKNEAPTTDQTMAPEAQTTSAVQSAPVVTEPQAPAEQQPIMAAPQSSETMAQQPSITTAPQMPSEQQPSVPEPVPAVPANSDTTT